MSNHKQAFAELLEKARTLQHQVMIAYRETEDLSREQRPAIEYRTAALQACDDLITILIKTKSGL